MPIYAEVDGVGRLEFPDGTDPSIIQATVKREVARRNPDMQRIEAAKASWADKNPVSQIGNVARGAVDVIGGGAQLLSRGANALGIVPESNPGGFLAGPKDVEAQNAQARSNIDSAFGKEAPGINPVRMLSSGALTMPFAPAGFLQAPTMIGRAAGAATGGAVAGALQEVPNPTSGGDFWKKKGLQAGVGAASAAVAQPVAEKVVGTVISGLNALGDKALAFGRNMSGANDMQKMVALTREAMRKEGLDYDAMSDQAKSGLLNDVQNALKSYSGVNPAAIARQGAFREEGVDPLRHWITRDPAEFTTIENLSHTDAGGVLKQKKNELDQFAMNRLTGMRGEQRLPENVGQAALSDLSSYIKGEKSKTNALYDRFRDTAPDVTGNPQRFVNDVFGGLEGKFASASLPPGLRELVNSISTGETPLTPSTLYQLQKMANGAKGADGSANFALGHLSRAIDKEMSAISATANTPDGKYAADTLKAARAQAAKGFSEMDQSKILRGVDSGTMAPENFGDILLGSSNREIASTWARLTPDTQQEVRAQVLDTLKTKAFAGASENSGKSASQATFNNYINDATNAQKLRMILGDEQFQSIKRLGLMLESAHMQPSGSAVNNSKTGGALLTALPKIADFMKAGNIPGNSAVSSMANSGIVQSAQYVPGEALGQMSPMIDPFLEEILKRRSGQYAGLLAGAAGPPAVQGLLH